MTKSVKTFPLTEAKRKLSGLVERVMKEIRKGLAALKSRKAKLYTLAELLG